MILRNVHVTNYRSIRDSEQFDVEPDKTILVGINESGKTAVLRALELINPPSGPDLNVLRDYPRLLYPEIDRKNVKAGDVRVAEAVLELEAADRGALAAVDPQLESATTLTLTRMLDGGLQFYFNGLPKGVTGANLQKDLIRLKAHLDGRVGAAPVATAVSGEISEWLERVELTSELDDKDAQVLVGILDRALPNVDEDDEKEEARLDKLRDLARFADPQRRAYRAIHKRVPKFVYYSTYFSVRPRIHLAQLAARQAAGDIDAEYDFGNLCLLSFLGFTAAELSELAKNPPSTDPENGESVEDHKGRVAAYQARLDERQVRLNAAEAELTRSIRSVWGDDEVNLRLMVDGDYLKVVAVDDLGVSIDLDQRSEGFRWLVSFFVVFKAQARDALENAVLLLDEPGMSLHALKQQEFRKTVSLLSADNQIIYTTHSPFMVGSDELDKVRVVEMLDRTAGTKVHSRIEADDPRAIFPLQAALGYELAQSMFTQERNLVCEGLTDMFYLEGLEASAREAKKASFKNAVALVPAGSASKVIYYVTLLKAQSMKVAALFDSDEAGHTAAAQEELVRQLKTNQILRTKDIYAGNVVKVEIEDLLRETLVHIAKTDLGWDIAATASSQTSRPIIDIFTSEIKDFSKYRLARAFLRWLGSHEFDELSAAERSSAIALIAAINKALP